MARRTRRRVTFGDVEVSSAAEGGHFTSTINDLSTAEIDLDLDLLGPDPVDYFAPLTLTLEDEWHRENIFTGAALSVELTGRTARVKGRAAPSMTELLMNGMVVENATAPEIIHATARGAGFQEKRMEIHGVENLPAELFEVVVPVSNVVISKCEHVGPAWLVPEKQGVRAIAGFDLTERKDDLLAEFKQADSYLLAIVHADRLYDAEERGLKDIDLALSWMATRGRYGLAKLPDGRGQPFSRAQALTTPKRGAVVLVRGLLTRRRWIRRPRQLLATETWDLDETAAVFDPPLPSRPSASDRQALAAMQLAITESDTVLRTQSLWQAIEAYAGGYRVARLFTRAERERLGELIPSDLTDAQRERLRHLFKEVNRAPLMDRFRARLAHDAVPIGEQEIALLGRLRKLRNDVTHGLEPSVYVDREELEHAISIVARILVYSVAAAGNS